MSDKDFLSSGSREDNSATKEYIIKQIIDIEIATKARLITKFISDSSFFAYFLFVFTYAVSNGAITAAPIPITISFMVFILILFCIENGLYIYTKRKQFELRQHNKS